MRVYGSESALQVWKDPVDLGGVVHWVVGGGADDRTESDGDV